MKKNAISIIFFLFCAFHVSAKTNKTTPNSYLSVDKKKMNHWVDSVFNRLSSDQRIGQLFMVVASGDNTDENIGKIIDLVNNQQIGGILFSKGNPVDQGVLTNLAQKAAKVPLMISLDGEWGLSMRLSNTTRFPRNMMLGAIRNDSLIYYYGLEVARQCRLMGIHVNFAPAIDVNSNPDNPVIGNRSFGEDPEMVARLGILYAKGLEDGGVMAVAKHFPGHGDTSTDSHKVLPMITKNKDQLEHYELVPFKKYIQAGFSGMMVAHLNIPILDKNNQPSSLSKAVVTDLLQDELGFSGLIFTDGLQMKGVSKEENYCVRALLAGNDILLAPMYPVKEYELVKKAVEEKVLSDSLIEARCKKVLSYKYIFGVNNTAPIDTVRLIENLNTPYADWLNRQLHKSAITLLKDNNKIIPLKELDKRKIAAISIGESTENLFHKRLKTYGDVTSFNVSDSDGLMKLKKMLEPYNTVIISVHKNNIKANDAIQSVCNGKESVLVFFTVPYMMSSYTTAIKGADALVLGYENTDMAQDYAAQAIFGGNAVNASIPVTVKGLFKQSKGIETRKVRLSYGVPEDVAIRSEKLDNIATIVNEGISAEAYPGCQVLIAKDGVIIYNRSFGTFEYDRKRMVTNDNMYDIASMTKASATVPAVMKLYDDGKIKLNNPISDFVPILKKGDKKQITIRDALLHETGLPSFIPYYMAAIDDSSYDGKLFNKYRTNLYSAEVDTDTWARVDFKYKPGLVSPLAKSGFVPLADNLYINKSYADTIIAKIADTKLRKDRRYLYSCLNFMLLKEAVEKVSGNDLNTFVQDNYFRKLGAVTTTYTPLQWLTKNRIVPTEKDDFLRKQLLQGYVHDEGAAFMGGISGNAGLFSNANDLAKLYQMWLNKGSYGGEEYLSEKTCQIFTNTKSATSRRGLGFDKPEMRTNKSSPCSPSTPASVYGHTGFTGTCFWVDPDNNMIYIFLSNRINEKRTHQKLMGLSIRQRIQEEIYRAMRKSTNK